MWRSLTEKVEGRDISPTTKEHHFKQRSRAGLSHSCNNIKVPAIDRCGIFCDAANAKRTPPQWQTFDTR
jgi:hypothetical protein